MREEEQGVGVEPKDLVTFSPADGRNERPARSSFGSRPDAWPVKATMPGKNTVFDFAAPRSRTLTLGWSVHHARGGFLRTAAPGSCAERRL